MWWVLVIILAVLLAIVVLLQHRAVKTRIATGGGAPADRGFVPLILNGKLGALRPDLDTEPWKDYDTPYLFAAAVEALERPELSLPPPTRKIAAGTFLFNFNPPNSQPSPDGAWYTTSLQDLETIAEWRNLSGVPGEAKKWRVVEEIDLIELGEGYDYYDLEGWIHTQDASFERTQRRRGHPVVDNSKAAAWLAQHGYKGWYENPGTLAVPLFMVEVMLTGDGQKHVRSA